MAYITVYGKFCFIFLEKVSNEMMDDYQVLKIEISKYTSLFN